MAFFVLEGSFEIGVSCCVEAAEHHFGEKLILSVFEQHNQQH